MQTLTFSSALLAQVVVASTLLSGVNALVIAAAARRLPPGRRRAALRWGAALAVALLVVFTLAATQLTRVPGLRFVGALLLLGVGFRLAHDDPGSAPAGRGAAGGPWAAALWIAAACLVMSLDTVVAAAGISGSNPVLMAVGLGMSVTAVLTFSGVVLDLSGGSRWVLYAGTCVLALTAAGLMVHGLAGLRQGPPVRVTAWADWGFRGAVACLCTTGSLWRTRHFDGPAAA